MEDPREVTERSVDWGWAVVAGIVATVVITISLGLFGMNIVKMLGSSMMPSAGAGAQYAVGGVIHMMVGLVFAVAYAMLFAQVRPWGLFLRAAVFGTALTAVALVGMPVMMAMMGGGAGAANPCNPCAAKPQAMQQNPCQPAANPCAQKPANPCAQQQPANPCAQKPANPCAAPAGNPCAAKQDTAKPGNACAANPCNPCGGGGGGNPYAGLVSLINHLIFAFVLAAVYGRRQ